TVAINSRLPGDGGCVDQLSGLPALTTCALAQLDGAMPQYAADRSQLGMIGLGHPVEQLVSIEIIDNAVPQHCRATPAARSVALPPEAGGSDWSDEPRLEAQLGSLLGVALIVRNANHWYRSPRDDEVWRIPVQMVHAPNDEIGPDRTRQRLAEVPRPTVQ